MSDHNNEVSRNKHAAYMREWRKNPVNKQKCRDWEYAWADANHLYAVIVNQIASPKRITPIITNRWIFYGFVCGAIPISTPNLGGWPDET